MDELTALEILKKHFDFSDFSITRCGVGMSGYVYLFSFGNGKYVLKVSPEKDAFSNSLYWFKKLYDAGVPVPLVTATGTHKGFSYIIMSYIKGKDIGLVYENLSREEKHKIARRVVDIQRKAAKLEPFSMDLSKPWYDFIDEMLSTAKERIIAGGYFDPEKVVILEKLRKSLEGYFQSLKPQIYLDDVSTKNLLIDNGAVSGIVDIDCVGYGDALTYIALTETALRNSGFDTEYSDFLLEETGLTKAQKKAYAFYCLLFCVDFMGERGMTFTDKKVEVNDKVIERLNLIYKTYTDKWNLS